jgi:transitional endoplasmic reticulum ATPase
MDSDTFERFSALDFSCDDDTQAKRGGLFGDYKQLTSGSTSDLDVQLVSALRKQHPELMVT